MAATCRPGPLPDPGRVRVTALGCGIGASADPPAWHRSPLVPDRQKFVGTVRFWDPDAGKGLAVIDVPAPVATALGGLKQMRVSGTLNGIEFRSSTMPAGGGRLALSVTKATLTAAGLRIGDSAAVEVERVGADGASATPLER
jgi:hypothetical protein